MKEFLVHTKHQYNDRNKSPFFIKNVLNFRKKPFDQKDKIRVSTVQPYKLLFMEDALTSKENKTYSYSVKCLSQTAKTFAISLEHFVHLLAQSRKELALNLRNISVSSEMRIVDQVESRANLKKKLQDMTTLPNG